jgi:hypothetical protein
LFLLPALILLLLFSALLLLFDLVLLVLFALGLLLILLLRGLGFRLALLFVWLSLLWESRGSGSKQHRQNCCADDCNAFHKFASLSA